MGRLEWLIIGFSSQKFLRFGIYGMSMEGKRDTMQWRLTKDKHSLFIRW